MILQIEIITIIMVVAYILTKWKLSVEWSMLSAAIAGGLAGAFLNTPAIGQLARHIVEGSFTYMDVVLIFVTATIFMDIVKESGGVDYIVKSIITNFYNKRIIALILLMLLLLIPGALTGAGSVSLLVVGAPVALALGYLGISKIRVTAILFILAGLSAAAPPVNIWAMITCAGTAIPYVGFELPLAIPVLILGTFTILFLGWKSEGSVNMKVALKEIPEAPKGMSGWRVFLPFLVFFGMLIAARIWPFSMPILGLPLEFVIVSLITLLVSPKRINILVLSRETVKKLLPLISTMIIVGMLQQVMSATGVRGLIAFSVISIPITLLFISLAVIIPVSEGVLTFGSAAILGVPLIWYFDSLGLHATIAIAGLSLLWPLGDGLPPTAVIGRFCVMVTEFKGSYWKFLRNTWVPWLIITLIGILMIVFSSQLTFLVR